MSRHIKIKLNNEVVILCSCEGIAAGLFKGRQRNVWNGDKFMVLNRYLCEQCKDNGVDDSGKAKLYKKLTYSETIWEVYNDILNKAFDEGMDFMKYFSEVYLVNKGLLPK